MNENIKEKLFLIFEKIKKDKKSLLIAVIGLLGMLLVSASELMPDSENIQEQKQSVYSYESSDERAELERLIGEIKGAGKVSVMLTYEGTAENVYANNMSVQTNNEENRSEEEHIILDKGNTEDGLLVKSIFPRVTGVAVVCEGGGSATVKNEITQMLKALYNISSSNISISEMEG